MTRKIGYMKKIKNELNNIKNDSVTGYIKRPTLVMSGNKELYIEGTIGIKEYTDREIKIYITGKSLTVNGINLSMCYCNRTTVRICGRINALLFEIAEKGE